jgi:hypothetical protein
MLSINNYYLILINELIGAFEKNRQLTEQNKIMMAGSQKKMSFALRIEFEFVSFFKNKKNIIAAYKNLVSFKKMSRKYYKKFSQLDIREKEDIYLQIEKIKKGLGEITTEKPLLFAGQLCNNLNNKFIIEFSNYEKKIKNELYGDLENRSYTSEELEAMASKFKDFPKEILQDQSSDKYSKKYL